MNTIIEKLKNTMIDLDQFDPDSLLVKSIKNVTKCNDNQALILSSTHCNMISTYGILFALDYISMSYEEFYSFCLDKKICNEAGYIYFIKTDIFKLLHVPAKIIEYKSLPEDRKPGDLYQVPINGKHHFTACGIDDDKTVLLFDTHAGYRGEYGSPINTAFKYHNDKPDCFKHIF